MTSRTGLALFFPCCHPLPLLSPLPAHAEAQRAKATLDRRRLEGGEITMASSSLLDSSSSCCGCGCSCLYRPCRVGTVLGRRLRLEEAGSWAACCMRRASRYRSEEGSCEP